MRLTRTVLAERFRDYAMTFYGQLGYANKSGALAIAGLALISIIAHPGNDLAPRLVYWASGLMLIMVTLVSWTIHPMFVGSAKLNLHDLFWPVVTGIAEYAMFGVLVWVPEAPKLWEVFPIAVTLQALTSWFLVVNRQAILRKHEDFSPELSVIESKMVRSVNGSFAATTIATLVYLALSLWTLSATRSGHGLSLVVASVLLASVILLWGFAFTTFRFLREAEEILSVE